MGQVRCVNPNESARENTHCHRCGEFIGKWGLCDACELLLERQERALIYGGKRWSSMFKRGRSEDLSWHERKELREGLKACYEIDFRCVKDGRAFSVQYRSPRRGWTTLATENSKYRAWMAADRNAPHVLVLPSTMRRLILPKAVTA